MTEWFTLSISDFTFCHWYLSFIWNLSLCVFTVNFFSFFLDLCTKFVILGVRLYTFYIKTVLGMAKSGSIDKQLAWVLSIKG
jgi:hypothetical protein